MGISRIMHQILGLVFCIASLPLEGVAQPLAPRAIQGMTDLQKWNFEAHGLVKLEGNYAFVWDQLIAPDQPFPKASTLPVPGPWTANDHPILGQASYQLRLKLPTRRDLHLMTLMIAPNARIFINGQEQANFGHVEAGPRAEVVTYPQRYHVFPLPADAHEVLITIHIHNMLQRPPGILQPLLVGTADQLVAYERGTKILDGIILGSLFALILYHIFLYVLRPKDRTPLFFGLCLFACFFYWLIAGYTSPINAFWDIDDGNRLTVFFLIFFVVPAFSEYVHLAYPGLFPQRFLKPFWVATGICFAVVALVPHQAKFLAMSVYFMTVFPTAAFLCGRTVWKAHRRGDHGSMLFFAGFLVLVASGIHDDMMYRMAFSNFPLIGWGVVSFSLIQSYFISARFSQAFTRAETSEAEVKLLNRDLEKIIEEKTRDIRSIMENIPLAVFMFDGDNFAVHKDYSVHSRSIFGRSDLQGMNALELLFDRSQLTSDEKSQATSAVESSLDQPVWNFETNAHCLPQEIKRQRDGGREEIFELSWSPIENAVQDVQRLLVTLRDVTDLRHLQQKNQEQNELLEILTEIVNVPARRFLDFLFDARSTVRQCERLMENARADVNARALVEGLFIPLHTLKGSARALPLRRLTDVVHQVEQLLAEQRGWDLNTHVVESFSQGLVRIQESLGLYERIARDMLSRTLAPEPLPATPFISVKKVLSDITACLPDLARDLDKAIPELILDVADLDVNAAGERLLQHSFIHILRNALDHGLERAPERTRQGKKPEGTLRIAVSEITDQVRVTVRDDGRGLALERLRQLGQERGLSTRELMDDERVACLIFESGYSTAAQLSEISGRGVGMSAVKQFVEQGGGRVRLLLDPENLGQAFRGFTLEMMLPADLFRKSQPSGLAGAA